MSDQRAEAEWSVADRVRNPIGNDRPSRTVSGPAEREKQESATQPCRCCGGSGRSEKDPIDQKTYMCGCCGGTGKEESGPEARPRCEVCGDPMPTGEEMFKFHGYSGPCPKPPLPRATFSREDNRLLWGSDRAKIQVALFVTLPSGQHDIDFEDRMVKALNAVFVSSPAEPNEKQSGKP